jgi:hypothetical protein
MGKNTNEYSIDNLIPKRSSRSCMPSLLAFGLVFLGGLILWPFERLFRLVRRAPKG